jgi:hypothetical protein
VVGSVGVAVASGPKANDPLPFSEDVLLVRLGLELVPGFEHLDSLLGEQLDTKKHGVCVVVPQHNLVDFESKVRKHKFGHCPFGSDLASIAVRKYKVELDVGLGIEDPDDVVVVTELRFIRVNTVLNISI